MDFFTARERRWRVGRAVVVDITSALRLADTDRYCRLSYPGHPHGCPNYNRVFRCPPLAPHIAELIENTPVFAVVSRFDLGEHVKRMRERHPGWSKRQLRNVLYWQGTARKRHREAVERVLNARKGYIALMIPEANGVNIHTTLMGVGIVLPWPPKRYTYQVALIGYKRRRLP